MIDVRKIRTGKDVAQLIRQSKSKWIRGKLFKGQGRCALGIIAHEAGIRDVVLKAVGQAPHGLEEIYQNNDVTSSKEMAADVIEREAGHLDFGDRLHDWLTGLCQLQKQMGLEPLEPEDGSDEPEINS